MDDKSRRLRTDDDADDCERGQSVGDLTRITRPVENPSSFGKESLRKNDGMEVMTVGPTPTSPTNSGGKRS